MATQKSSNKAAHKGAKALPKGAKSVAKETKDSSKKGSKLASLKSLLLGGDSKKATSKKAAGKTTHAAPAKSKASQPAVPAKKKAELTTATLKAKAAPAPAPAAKKETKAKAVTPAVKAPVSKPAPAKTKGAGGRGKAAGSIRLSANAVAEAVCREVACEGLATALGYCRLHYIKNWKKIKRKEVILKEGKLNQYIEELVAKYPDKYLEAIRQDLTNDKDFAKVIYDLDLDESVDDFDVEGDADDSIIDNIKRDFEDDGDAF